MKIGALLVIGSIAIVSCAGVEKRVNDACDVVAELDDQTAYLLEELGEHGASDEVMSKAEKLGEAVVKLHGICFREPADGGAK